MHDNSMRLMIQFVREYEVNNSMVLDMGSQDINGSYRELIGENYIGADIVDGPNVDIIIDSEEWKDLDKVNCVISGQVLEHVEDTEKFMSDIYSKLKPGGLICLIAPSAGTVHNYPLWNGHFSIERMTEVVRSAGFEIIECVISNVVPYKDCRCIAKKNEDKQF